MADPRQDPRIKHGLIPVLVAMRVTAERKRREEEAAKKAGAVPEKPKKKRGWFG
ncbi:MAG: hypothetical protein Q7U72_11400 [Brevundimonas sp.]|jgi:hypothetical protein|uniref:hypothetical protein n=1 Tax=Brevundimonas sp. TaxID=1871086 RepID=UPI0027234F91|nr:hypothetical protein [Brevundimonas sp.]MDO9078036.1 hypothetical protein [Brevundimonas sp.]MDP3079867.1 hypothetical protein [Brevundimonas sp.]MDZ4061065.1 hypothetical protein [Brevundimonas sp.]